MRTRTFSLLVLVLVLGLFFRPLRGPNNNRTPSPPGPVNYSYRIVNRLPRPQAFTQGLVYYDGYFYESTGLYDALPSPGEPQ